MDSAIYAEQYELIYADYLHAFDITPRICQLVAETDRSHCVIDLGCGTGVQIGKLAQALAIAPSASLGIDNAREMLALARKRLPEGVTLLDCDLANTAEVVEGIGSFLNAQSAQSLICLCLGNTIGLLDDVSRSSMLQGIAKVKQLWISNSSHRSFSCFIEFRDAMQYGRATLPTIESLGHTRHFCSFYLREDTSDKTYKVDLYSLRLSTDNQSVEAYRGHFAKGFYVTCPELRDSLEALGFSVSEPEWEHAGLGGRTVFSIK